MDRLNKGEERANYIKEKLGTTKIDRVYWPLIIDAVMRRQRLFNLNDDIFKRDVDTFAKNVKKVEIKELEEHIMGQFSTSKKKIIINAMLFKEKDFETIFEVFCHECSHAMNFEKQGTSKYDRTFNKKVFGLFSETAIMEAATQSEAESMACSTYAVHGYENITKYINAIASSFGISKKDFLKSAIEGRKELNRLLNGHELSVDNPIFQGIVTNMEIVNALSLKKMTNEDKGKKSNNGKLNENLKNAHSKIYSFVEKALLNRINSLDFSDLDKLKEEFEKILVNQETVQNIMENSVTKLYKTKEEIRESTGDSYNIVNLKLKCIYEIMNNPEIQNKQELISLIQSKNSSLDIVGMIVKNNLKINLKNDFTEEIPIDDKTRFKYNSETLSNVKFKNKNMIDYLIDHEQEMYQPKESTFKRLSNWFKDKLGIRKQKLLPSGNESRVEEIPIDQKQEKPSWDLSNWGINKEDLSQVQDHTRTEISEKDNTQLESNDLTQDDGERI